MSIKRHLYLWHRWLGIGLCLFMALWFISGAVMLYVGHPKLTPSERLAHLPVLPADCCTQLPAAWADAPLERMRLTSLGGRPFYLLVLADGQRLTLDAQTGEPLAAADADWALANARQYAPDTSPTYGGLAQEDTWTHSRGLDAERPLHRVVLGDEANTWLYLSSKTGRVVLDSNLYERSWNWLGAWLHWLYAVRGGFGVENGWRWIVIGLSLVGTVMAVLGMAVGVMRWRFSKPYRSGSRSPYPDAGWLHWHHIGGLLFGVVLALWVFSGMMSMRPWGVTDNRSQLDVAAVQGGPLRAADFRVPVGQALATLREAGLEAVEMDWRRLGGSNYVVARDRFGNSRILESNQPNQPFTAFAQRRLLTAALGMAPQVSVHGDWLERFDNYYFARAEQSMYGVDVRPLPVLRVRFADPAQSWVYLDPASGEVVARHDQSQRTGRWLFNLLHSWDWQPLLERPRLREALVLSFSLGGLLICLSGIVVGWRRLRPRPSRPSRR